MTKNLFFYLTVVVIVLIACSEDKNKGDETIPVASVSLNLVATKLNIGSSSSLTASVRPYNATNKAVTWESSDTVVATVSNGKVNALSLGTTNITVITEDGNKTSTCSVTVIPIAVNSVKLDKVTATLNVNDTLRFTATVLPDNAANKAVTWKSSNTSAVTVNNGLITAVFGGISTITVTTQDGAKTAAATVTVLYDGPMTLGDVTWATANVDDYQAFADRPDMYTKFYQWNRGTAWSATGSVTGWNSSGDDSDTWTVNPCPAGWRIPTKEEFETLHKAGSTWVESNARGNVVEGRFYGPRHTNCALPNNMYGCVFLPASGGRNSSDGSLGPQGKQGYYWSSLLDFSGLGRVLHFQSEDSDISTNAVKAYGFNIRCVQ